MNTVVFQKWNSCLCFFSISFRASKSLGFFFFFATTFIFRCDNITQFFFLPGASKCTARTFPAFLSAICISFNCNLTQALASVAYTLLYPFMGDGQTAIKLLKVFWWNFTFLVTWRFFIIFSHHERWIELTVFLLHLIFYTFKLW